MSVRGFSGKAIDTVLWAQASHDVIVDPLGKYSGITLPEVGIAAAGVGGKVLIKYGSYTTVDDMLPLDRQRIDVEPGTVFNMASGKRLYIISKSNIEINGIFTINTDISSPVGITGSTNINAQNATISVLSSYTPDNYAPIVSLIASSTYVKINIKAASMSLTNGATSNSIYGVLLQSGTTNCEIGVDLNAITLNQASYVYGIAIYNTFKDNIIKARVRAITTTTGNTGTGIFVENNANVNNCSIIGSVTGCDAANLSNAGGRINVNALDIV